MKVGVLGTGGVAQTLARRWSVSGHEITLGSRDAASKEGLGFLLHPSRPFSQAMTSW